VVLGLSAGTATRVNVLLTEELLENEPHSYTKLSAPSPRLLKTGVIGRSSGLGSSN
jgi:hypothetical protein